MNAEKYDESKTEDYFDNDSKSAVITDQIISESKVADNKPDELQIHQNSEI